MGIFFYLFDEFLGAGSGERSIITLDDTQTQHTHGI